MYPHDWPGPGAIDLATHDRPHRSSMTEWWYVNSHVETVDGRKLSLFAAFFRIINGRDEATKQPIYAHSCTWAISDADARVYHDESRVDARAPQMGLERIKKGQGSKDARLNRAMTEVLEAGRVPGPDQAFEGDIHVAQERLALDYAGARYDKLDDGSYRLRLFSKDSGAGCDVVFHPEMAPVRHGDDGVVKGHAGEDMFYYFIPRCRVTGTLTLDARPVPIASGRGWYNHEFGGFSNIADTAEPEAVPRSGATVDIAWNWVAAQLDGGRAITAYQLVKAEDSTPLHEWAIFVDEDGTRRQCNDFKLEPTRWFRSTRTFYDYPVAWKLTLPSQQIALEVTAAFDDQEFITCISKPAFWEGRADIAGTHAGVAVRGLGYVERSGFQPVRTLDEFFGAVGEEVQKSVATMLPSQPTHAEAQALIASKNRPQYMDGVDVPQLQRTLLQPIREMTDRGGKSWRSYAALACCDVVGGDSRRYARWLAAPEMLHVGSLIVDDVQDKSTLRRGGPACHLVFGEPLAINSGTAAYFMAQRLLVDDAMAPEIKLRLYELYFEAMCAGHAGQALDLEGLGEAMPAAVASGDGSALERRILAIHRLKTAAPAAALARMGAVVGGGTEAQIEAVGGFFEAVGLAFQIIDDVLNLRGFQKNLKTRGEDIANGVITMPVAKAMGLLPEAERERLWKTLQSKPKELPVIAATVETLETSGAIEACVTQARALVEAAWQQADAHLPDTLPKIMLRAFGWYILERHY